MAKEGRQVFITVAVALVIIAGIILGGLLAVNWVISEYQAGREEKEARLESREIAVSDTPNDVLRAWGYPKDVRETDYGDRKVAVWYYKKALGAPETWTPRDVKNIYVHIEYTATHPGGRVTEIQYSN